MQLFRVNYERQIAVDIALGFAEVGNDNATVKILSEAMTPVLAGSTSTRLGVAFTKLPNPVLDAVEILQPVHA